MVMSDNEVKMNVLQAKDPRAQIKICAELNATTQAHIKDILREQGVDLRAFNVKQPKRPFQRLSKLPKPRYRLSKTGLTVS